MDERLQNALDFSNFRQTLYLEKKRLQEKLKVDLTLSHNGGKFYIDRNFIVYINLISPEEGNSSITILDDKLNPIYIENLLEFQKIVSNQYSKAINQYFIDFENLKKKRSVKAIIEL